MKLAAFTTRLSKLTFVTCLTASTLVVTAAMAESTVKRLNSKNPLFKIVGQVSVEKYPNDYGQGLFVGKDGCHILTNYHVAFADGVDESGKSKTVENPATGQVVTFSFSPDESGKFQNVVKGKVIEFGNYMPGAPRGRLGDLALVRLESCQGKNYAGLDWDPTAIEKGIPDGKLATVSLVRTSAGKNIVAMEEGCEAFKFTPVTGLIVSTCMADPGTSSNLLLAMGNDNTYRLAGIGSSQGPLPSGQLAAVGISAKVAAKFVAVALGNVPTAMAPMADTRKPQSEEQTAMAKPQAVVR